MAKLKDGFYKQTAETVGSDLFVLLAGGGMKPLADFATSTLDGVATEDWVSKNYLALSGGSMTGPLIIKKTMASEHWGAITLKYDGGWSGYRNYIAGINVEDSQGIVGRFGITYDGGYGKFVVRGLYNSGYDKSGEVFSVNANGVLHASEIYESGVRVLTSLPSHTHAYLPLAGGLMTDAATIQWSNNKTTWDNVPNGFIGISNLSADATLGYYAGISFKGYYGMQFRNYGGNSSLEFRGHDSSNWQPWVTIITSSNYNSYSPTLTGGGAYGTWGINITGSSASAGSLSGFYTTLSRGHVSNSTSYTATTHKSTYFSDVNGVERGTWDYAGNGYVTTDFGNIHLAGTATLSIGSNNYFHTLFMTPFTSSGVSSPLLGEMLFYSYNYNYPSGWRRVLTNANFSSYAVPFYKLTSGTCSSLSEGLTFTQYSDSTAAHSNHSAFLTVNSVGTPFQLQFPDSTEMYIYKRYYSGGWSAWSKISAGYADSATYATNSTYLYASDSPYRYGDSAPYYMRMRYNVNGDSRWYLSVYPETPKTVAVDHAYRADMLYGYSSSPNNSHPGHGARVFYSWDIGHTGSATSGYSNGITIGSHVSDQAYGFQIVQNMWDDRTYTRRYNGGWQSWKTLAWTSDIPTVTDYYWADQRITSSAVYTASPTLSTLRVQGSGGGRATIYMVSASDVPNDLWFGAGGQSDWSLTSRNSSEGRYFGLYNNSLGWAFTVDKSNNRFKVSEWIQFESSAGLYWPNTYGAHFYPNNTSSYGQFKLLGDKNGYSGIHFGSNVGYLTLMDNGSDKGAYQENWGWLWYFNARNGKLSLRCSSDYGADVNINGSVRTNSTIYSYGLYHLSYGSSAYALTTDGGAAHIGSMSVNYANSAYSASCLYTGSIGSSSDSHASAL